jgi:hypothetical protein
MAIATSDGLNPAERTNRKRFAECAPFPHGLQFFLLAKLLVKAIKNDVSKNKFKPDAALLPHSSAVGSPHWQPGTRRISLSASSQTKCRRATKRCRWH